MPRSFAAAVAAALLAISADAFALAQRTFVATTGNDANTAANCSLVAPCRSFASAMTVTAAKGEIVVLDSGGYGRVTIDKSVAILSPPGVHAGISVLAGTNGVDVDGAGIAVTLRGLFITGQGGDSGIVFTQGSRLYIEQCTIANLGLYGVRLLIGHTLITDTTVRDNLHVGIRVEGPVFVTLDRTRVERNASTGVEVANSSRLTVTGSVIAENLGNGGFDIVSDDGSSTTVVGISESSISHNSTHGIFAHSLVTGSRVRLAVARNTINRNGLNGVLMSGLTGSLTAIVTDNVIAHNTDGLAAAGVSVTATIATNAISGSANNGVAVSSGAVLKSRSNNVIQDNANDVSGALTFVAGD